MSRVFAVIYVAAVLGLVVAAASIWRLSCGSFGCMGIGVAWFAWVAIFVPVLVTGVVLRPRPSLGIALRKITRVAVWLQIATGAILLAVWSVKNAT